MTIKTDNSFHFRGKDVFGKSHEALLKVLKKSLSRGKSQNIPFLVFTPNPEQMMIAESDSSFNQVLQRADILVPDGVGLVIASKILSTDNNPKIEERIPGRMLVEDILKIAKEDKLKVLLIGGKDYSQTGMITVNGVEVDWTSGYLDAFNPTQGEEVALQKRIQQVSPDIIFVAFGAPMQEKWLVQHKEVLSNANVKLGMAVGGSFDYLLGFVPSPPSWVSKMGFEWLFRLVVQPWRFKRQVKLINFMMLVVEEKWQSM
jgi:N-acetylglucosaminyldiphosphoundecaprenol N-acetyl-beta-D-mannosaminyltransferase